MVKITRRRTGPSNPHTQALVTYFNKTDQPAIYRRVSELLDAPKRNKNRNVINVDELNKLVKDGDIVIVPTKVLGSGVITKKITIGALQFSGEAKRKIVSSGGKAMDLVEFWEKHPKGTNVRLIVGEL